MLGTETWGPGPTAVVLKMDQGSTYGVLANRIWDLAAEDKGYDFNASSMS